MLTNAMEDVGENRVRTMVNLSSQDNGEDDYLGELRTTKPCVIPVPIQMILRELGVGQREMSRALI